MKVDFKIDDSKLKQALKNVNLSADDLRDVGFAGSAEVKTSQKTDVPVGETGATRASINDHIIKSTPKYFEDDIGPETEYAPNIEYGTGEFAEGGKGRKGGWVYPYKDGFRFTLGMHPRPFVRPSTKGKVRINAFKAISNAFGLKVVSKWQK